MVDLARDEQQVARGKQQFEMTALLTRFPWVRIAAESAAIIASILLAFAIDAWWDNQGEHRRSLAQLATIRTEFVEVEDRLVDIDEELVGLRESVADLLAHVGPETPLESPDTLASLMDLSFRAAKIELPMSSLPAILSAGGLPNVANDELKTLLATWPASVSRLRNQSGLLEENREEIIRYLHDKFPTLAIAQKTNQMSAYPQSSFVVGPEVLQRDMKIEGLFGNRGMLIEDTLEIVSELRAQVAESIVLIEVDLGK